MTKATCSFCGGKFVQFRRRRLRCGRCSAVYLASGKVAQRGGEALFAVPDANPFGAGGERLFTLGEVTVALAPYGWLFLRIIAALHPGPEIS